MDTPSSPPAGPIIPRGLATNLGVLAAAVAAIAAGVAAILDGDHTPETIAALITAGGIVYGVVRGRMDQSAAALRRPPAPILVPPSLAPAPTTYAGAGGLEDPLLDDPTALDYEPELSAEDLAGRSEGSADVRAHSDLGEPGTR